jgi:hypothetical protein
MKLLNDIAEIRTGYPFRQRPVRVASGGCALVQMGDLDSVTGWVKSGLEQVEVSGNWKKHELFVGDVLLASRGESNAAAQYAGDLRASNDDNTPDVPAVAAAHLLVIRLKPGCGVHPFFLAWFLNQPDTQAQLRAVRSGTNIPFLPIEQLRNLEIPVPSDDLQHHMVSLYQLSLEEERLAKQLQQKRRELMAGVFQCLLATADNRTK